MTADTLRQLGALKARQPSHSIGRMDQSNVEPGTSDPAAHVACGACHREIPLSTAVWRESSDYVAYFCGLECYDRWRQQ